MGVAESNSLGLKPHPASSTRLLFAQRGSRWALGHVNRGSSFGADGAWSTPTHRSGTHDVRTAHAVL